jgi:gliding motility-associated protein GldE
LDDGIPIHVLNILLTPNIFNPINQIVVYGLVVVLILLFLSAILSSAEVAIFSLDNKQLNKMEENGDSTDKAILDRIKNPKELLATLVLSITLFNLGVVIVFESVFENLFNPVYMHEHKTLEFIVKIVFETLVIVLFAEVIPKVYATQNNYNISRTLIRPIIILSKIFSIFTNGLIVISTFLEKRLQTNKQNLTAQDIDEAIDITSIDEDIKNDSKILKGLVKFGNITVTQIMRSRVDVIAIDTDSNFKELLDTVKESGYSRIPTYKDDIDKITGIVYAKDLLPHLDKSEDFQWQTIIRPAFFIPENKKIDDLLEDFRTKRVHMAIIVDEYGGTSGIITLEDILEEVIGEIKDEFDDVTEIDYKKLDANNYIFEARTNINDFCKVLEIKNDSFDAVIGDADSLAGLMLELYSDLPKEGDELNYNQYKFTILEANETRIIRIKVTINND